MPPPAVRDPAQHPAGARSEAGGRHARPRGEGEDQRTEQLGRQGEQGFRGQVLGGGELEADEDAAGVGGEGEVDGVVVVVAVAVDLARVCAAAAAAAHTAGGSALALGDRDGGVVVVFDAAAAAVAADILDEQAGGGITITTTTTPTTAIIIITTRRRRRRQLHEIPVRDRAPGPLLADLVGADAEDGRLLGVARPEIIDDVAGRVGEQLRRERRRPAGGRRDLHRLGPRSQPVREPDGASDRIGGSGHPAGEHDVQAVVDHLAGLEPGPLAGAELEADVRMVHWGQGSA